MSIRIRVDVEMKIEVCAGKRNKILIYPRKTNFIQYRLFFTPDAYTAVAHAVPVPSLSLSVLPTKSFKIVQ